MCNQNGDTVKITDFNVSKFCTSKEKFYSLTEREIDIKMFTNTGTLQFKAPEMISEKTVQYNQTVDMWGAGVTLYQMLSSTLPFYSSYEEESVKKIQNGEFDFEGERWKFIGNLAKDLIKQCLQIDPKKRLLPDEGLNHPWVLNNVSQKNTDEEQR